MCSISADPLVSIIIPCWNAERFIAEAIDSALAQTYATIEVIVIDDGSKDGSLDIIKSFGTRVRWETGPNRGACAARNRGIELASGEFIQFLDADDLLDRDKLTMQVPLAMQDTRLLVYSDYRTQDHAGNNVQGLHSPSATVEDSVCFVLNNYGMQTAAPLHWKPALERVNGFRTTLRCSQERDLHLRLACAGFGFRHLPVTLFTVRRVPGSVSSNFVNVLDQHMDLAMTALKLLVVSGGLTEERRLAIAGFLARDARAYLQRGFEEKAKEYFVQAYKVHPSGGLNMAYGPLTRKLLSFLKPETLERLVQYKRRLMKANFSFL